MTTLWAFAVAIALLVVFHELGHYWVARLCGVKVLRFSVGFGKALFIRKFPHGETEWVISAIPLGGYVKMLDEREGEVEAHEVHRAFNRRPVWQRMAIVVAGPLANLLLAVILYWALFMYGVPGLKPVLGKIAPHTPAAEAQLQEQETIVSINGAGMQNWQDVRWELLDLVLRGGAAHIDGKSVQGADLRHELDLGGLTPADLDGDFMEKLGLQAYQPTVRPVIGRLVEGGVAEHAGLRVDDRIVRVDGRAIAEWQELVEIVRSHPGDLLRMQVERGGGLLEMDVRPEVISENGGRVGKIGASPRVDRHELEAIVTETRYAPVAASRQALRKTWETIEVSLKMMGKMALGEISMKNLSGPIAIADYAGQSAQMGGAAYLGFLALISVSLGILNLLPIPVLDGGHLLYYMAELIKGSPVPEKVWEAGQNVGVALLVTLMVFALYNDISRLIFP